MKTTFDISQVAERWFRRWTLAMAAACLALSSYSAIAADWPPTLNPDPAIQPPKWDWQLDVPVQVNPDPFIEIYDVQMFENELNGLVGQLHALGKKVICYVDVGSWENFRDDKNAFPASILGNTYAGFPDEKWLDVRDVNPNKSTTGTELAKILRARFLRAKNMGCDGVEPDNMDGYDQTAHDPSGFPLTYEDQMYFNLWVAETVHGMGMLVGLKNDINQALDSRTIEAFDFVVSEQCFQYGECNFFSGFLAANKPVFEAEYSRDPPNFCPSAKTLRISAIKKRNSLNSFRQGCDSYYSTPANMPPVAAFSQSCTGLSCSFINNSYDSDGSITTRSWNFGDGSATSSEQNPSHTYAASGTYSVALSVTDNGSATDTFSQSITVFLSNSNTAPTAAFSFSCTNLNCNFTDASTDTDGTITTRSWNFGDGTTSAAQNPSRSYAAAGTYTVWLTVTDNGGATNAISHDVTVNAASTQPLEMSFVSIAREDGWVLESGENSNVGGSRNTGGTGNNAIRFGDDSSDRQYKGMLSFDTSAIPEGAVIISAKLDLTRGGTAGSNAFNTHGIAYVDVKNGSFNGNAALQNTDFEAAADAVQAATVTNQGGTGMHYTIDLNAAALSNFNSAGRTQMRLYFSLDDNDDLGNDYVGFYSADNSNAAYRPKLIVTYQ